MLNFMKITIKVKLNNSNFYRKYHGIMVIFLINKCMVMEFQLKKINKDTKDNFKIT